MSSAMETSARPPSEPGRQEESVQSPGTRSHSGSDEEPMPMTPSSGMGRHQGAPTQPESKRSEQADDIEMVDATGNTVHQTSTRATSPLSSPEAEMRPRSDEDYEEGLDEEAAQYTQPAEL
jgi:hypothetical protein